MSGHRSLLLYSQFTQLMMIPLESLIPKSEILKKTSQGVKWGFQIEAFIVWCLVSHTDKTGSTKNMSLELLMAICVYYFCSKIWSKTSAKNIYFLSSNLKSESWTYSKKDQALNISTNYSLDSRYIQKR